MPTYLFCLFHVLVFECEAPAIQAGRAALSARCYGDANSGGGILKQQTSATPAMSFTNQHAATIIVRHEVLLLLARRVCARTRR